jgi:gamma-glutamylputrescine oxidase
MLNIEQLSYWEKQTFFKDFEFLIIGAGIVGYSTAIHLRELHPSSKIVILEKGYLPSGASSKNAGFACFGSATELIDDLQHTEKTLVWETVARRWEGLRYLKQLIGESDLELEVNGSWDLITKPEEQTVTRVRDQLSNLNSELFKITGEQGVYAEDPNLHAKFGFENLSTSFFNRLEGQINTGKMIRRFYQKAVEQNIDILFGINVLNYEALLHTVKVNTSVGEINARNLLICVNGFAQDLVKEDVHPARAQVLVTEKIQNLKIKGTFHYDRGYYYFRNIDERILLGGGRNLDFEGETSTALETTETIMSALEQLLTTVILPGRKTKIEHRWAGIMGVGKTKAPIVKKIEPNVGIGVRMGGMGVAIGSLVGKDLAEMFS